MSLNEERMFVLKMLEEGKINSEEAARLIQALEAGSQKSSYQENSRQSKQPNFYDEISKLGDKINQWKKDFKKMYNEKEFDKVMEEFGNKVEKIGKTVASTTFNAVERMIEFVGSFVDTNTFNIFGSYKVVERQFEVPAEEGMDINITGINGNIHLKKHQDDKISIRSKVRSPQNDADEILVFSTENDSVNLSLSKDSGISVSHEIFVPAIRFKKITLNTRNGKIYVEDSLSDYLNVNTKNGPIDLAGVTCNELSASTKNGKVQIGYVIAKNIDINTSNSIIDIKNVKAAILKALTTNGKIFIENAQNYQDTPQLDMNLKTTNGGIKVNMNDMDNKGYKVKAQTGLGSVSLLIPEMTYNTVTKRGTDGTFIEAESKNYEQYAERVYVNAETMNGDIEVVK
ncbi:MAG TPA: DUF4097 domain-containing protein [Clostridiaceae bacterium]|nr:DUF4097 domain-containing protein [Clostridiaceae bacterium]